MSKVAKLDLRTLEFQVCRNSVSTSSTPLLSARTRANGKGTYRLLLSLAEILRPYMKYANVTFYFH